MNDHTQTDRFTIVRLRRFRATIVVFASAAFVLGVGYLLRDAGASPPAAAQPPKVQGEIQYVGPDTYILLDSEGRPQPMLGMSYEEFVMAWKEQQNVRSHVAEPRFTIEQLLIDGEVKEDHAILTAHFAVRVLTDGPVQLPLGLAGAIMRQQPDWKHPGEGDASTEDDATSDRHPAPFVEFDPQRGGFVAHLEGRPGELHEVTLNLVVPLVREGIETGLRLNCPKALVSGLRLDIPTTVVDATVSDRSLLSTTTNGAKGDRLTAEGLTGDFRLTWSAPESRRPELATVLSSTGAISISIDGHSIRSEARLTIRSFGGSFDRFRVRLPPGANLIQDGRGEAGRSEPNYRVTVDQSPPTQGQSVAAGGSGQQVVLVELAEKRILPIEIELATEQPLGLPGGDRAVELAGFEVIGAVRQFGDVALQVADDWQLRWDTGPFVRQVESGDLAAALREQTPTASFQYDRQPWSLRAQIVARPFRVHVTPEFEMDLEPDQANLRVWLVYQLPGARAFEFRVRLRGWELTADPIESNGLVDRDRVLVTRDGLLILPLSQASPRRAELAFSLRRDLRRGATELELPLPVPEVDSVGAAELRVLASAGMELLPDVSHARGLSPTPVTSDTPFPAFDDGRQVFRYRSYLPDAVFAADRTVRSGEVSAEVETQIEVDRQYVQAAQTIDYQVHYQSVGKLHLKLPADWSIVDSQVELWPWSAKFDDRAAATVSTQPGEPIVVTVPGAAAPAGDEPREIQIALPQPRLGRFRVRLAYERVRGSDSDGGGPTEWELPQPMDVRLTAHHVRVAGSTELDVSLDTTSASASAWQLVDRGGHMFAVDSLIKMVTNDADAQLPLRIRYVDAAPTEMTTIERVWLQMWRSGSMVQDRAAYQFRTAVNRVVVELPPQVMAQEVETLVDGELAAVTMQEEGRLTVELENPPTSSDRSPSVHTLELRYRHPADTGLIVHRTFIPPQLVGTSALSDVYWQVVLPGDEHVVRSPTQLAAVDRWQWLDMFIGRRPLLSQSDLERWVGGSHQSEYSPSFAQNAYVYSGVAPVSSIEFVTAPRWLIVFVASGAVLAIATFWLYLPVARRKWLGIATVVGVAGLAATYPTAAVLLGQASLLGWALAGAVALMRKWQSRPIALPPASTGSTNLRPRVAMRSDSFVAPSMSPPASSVSTTPVSIPESER